MLKTFGVILIATGLILLVALVVASTTPLTYRGQGYYSPKILKLFSYDSKYTTIVSIKKFSKLSVEGLQYYLTIKVFPRTDMIYITVSYTHLTLPTTERV